MDAATSGMTPWEKFTAWIEESPERQAALSVAAIALVFVVVIGVFILVSRPVKPESLDFTVTTGEGPTCCTSYQTSIDIAERFKLPIYLGPIEKDIPISPKAARLLEPATDEVRITVLVPRNTRFVLPNIRDPSDWQMIPPG